MKGAPFFLLPPLVVLGAVLRQATTGVFTDSKSPRALTNRFQEERDLDLSNLPTAVTRSKWSPTEEPTSWETKRSREARASLVLLLSCNGRKEEPPARYGRLGTCASGPRVRPIASRRRWNSFRKEKEKQGVAWFVAPRWPNKVAVDEEGRHCLFAFSCPLGFPHPGCCDTDLSLSLLQCGLIRPSKLMCQCVCLQSEPPEREANQSLSALVLSLGCLNFYTTSETSKSLYTSPLLVLYTIPSLMLFRSFIGKQSGYSLTVYARVIGNRTRPLRVFDQHDNLEAGPRRRNVNLIDSRRMPCIHSVQERCREDILPRIGSEIF